MISVLFLRNQELQKSGIIKGSLRLKQAVLAGQVGVRDV